MGSLSFSYVDLKSAAASATAVGATLAAPIGVTKLGWSEKRLGERTRKSRCWSKTCSTPSTVPSRATVSANSSRSGRERAEVKLT